MNRQRALSTTRGSPGSLIGNSGGGVEGAPGQPGFDGQPGRQGIDGQPGQPGFDGQPGIASKRGQGL